MYSIIIIILSVFFTLAALAIFIKQLNVGLVTTGLNDKFNWGLYIQGFFYLSAIAAGIFIFVAVTTLFEIKEFQTLSKIGGAISFSCFISAGILLGADLGKPLRVLKIIQGKNFISPLTWDFYMLTFCVLLNFIYIIGLVSEGSSGFIWGVLSLFVALGYIMIHTLFFLSRVEAGFKSNPFLGLNTLSESIWGGSAVMLLIAIGIGYKVSLLFKILIILSILNLMPQLGEFIAAANRKERKNNHTALITNFIIMLILLTTSLLFGYNEILLGLLSILILVAVFCEKGHLVKRYQDAPTIPFPYSKFEELPQYNPTMNEWVLTLGSLGICIWLSSLILFLKGLYM